MVWVKIGTKVKNKLTFIYAQDFNSCLLGGSPVFDPPKHPLMWTFLSLYTTLKKMMLQSVYNIVLCHVESENRLI